MSRRQYGTRFTTGCGHSWRKRRPRFRIYELLGRTADCPQCGELLIIPAPQFKGMQLDSIPAEVHAPLFHKYLHQQDERWPVDGSGTGYVESPVGGE